MSITSRSAPTCPACCVAPTSACTTSKKQLGIHHGETTPRRQIFAGSHGMSGFLWHGAHGLGDRPEDRPDPLFRRAGLGRGCRKGHRAYSAVARASRRWNGGRQKAIRVPSGKAAGPYINEGMEPRYPDGTRQRAEQPPHRHLLRRRRLRDRTPRPHRDASRRRRRAGQGQWHPWTWAAPAFQPASNGVSCRPIRFRAIWWSTRTSLSPAPSKTASSWSTTPIS